MAVMEETGTGGGRMVVVEGEWHWWRKNERRKADVVWGVIGGSVNAV